MRFETTLLQMGNNTGIEVPPEVVEGLGGGKRAAVTVDVNGYVYSSTMAVMGGRQLIPFSADKRKATGLAGGDPITVELTLDTTERTVELPTIWPRRSRTPGCGRRSMRWPRVHARRTRAAWPRRRRPRRGPAVSRRSSPH